MLSSDAKKMIKIAMASNKYGLEVSTAIDAALTSSAIEDSITNGVIDKAPSENAVFDALALKADSSILVQTILNGDTTHASSSDALFDALALKADSSALSSYVPIAKLSVIESSAAAGGGASEALTFTGLLASDTIFCYMPSAIGVGVHIPLSVVFAAPDSATVTWDADPGAGAKVKIFILSI